MVKIGLIGGTSGDGNPNVGKGAIDAGKQPSSVMPSYDFSQESYPGVGLERTTSTTPTESTTNNNGVKDTTSTKQPTTDNKANGEVSAEMQKVQAYFADAPSSLANWLSIGSDSLKTHLDSLPEGTNVEDWAGYKAVASRQTEDGEAQYAAYYDPNSGNIVRKMFREKDGTVRTVNYEYDNTGKHIGYSVPLARVPYHPGLNDNMDAEGLSGHVNVTATYDSKGGIAYYTVDGTPLNYTNTTSFYPKVGGLQNYTAEPGGGFHLMTSEEYERFNNQ